MESQTRKILIVDDNEIDREVYRRYLSRHAKQLHEFVEHSTLVGALEVAKDSKPDCILLDYQLPDGTGVDFLQQLNSIGGTRDFPVVMLTGTGNESVAVVVMKAGAQDYITKDRLNAEVLRLAVDGAIYKAKTERLLEQQRHELERLFREAQEANARKDNFLAALSHELRTPLTPVLTAVSAIDPREAAPDQIREVFRIIKRNIELEARLIDDMLDLTRIARGKLKIDPQEVDVHSVLGHAVATCEEEIRKKELLLTWDLAAENYQVCADPARLQQVFWNVISNAVKFTPPQGSITLSTRNVEGDHVEIQVADSGIGINASKLEMIFDAFEQVDAGITRNYGGLGLGLAISKALVEAHDGRIHAESDDGQPGARFIITLKCGDLNSGAGEPTSESPGETSEAPGSTTILLVEDHEDSILLLSHILRNQGYRVLMARSVGEAFKLFKTEQVDGIISDIGLPDGNGIDLMKSISALRKVPAIALSGFGMESDIQRSREAGFVEHLTKPIDWQKLRAALDRLPLRQAGEAIKD